MKKIWFTTKQRGEIISLYLSGESAREVGNKFGVSDEVIFKRLRDWGVPRRDSKQAAKCWDHSTTSRKCVLDESVFDTITEESAYWIGFLMADGCIRKQSGCDTPVVSVTSKDIEHVDKFKGFLKSAHKIGISGGGKYGSLSVTSNKLAGSLANYGVVPRKSLIAEARGGIENNRHFWRGVIDGDGSVGISHQKFLIKGRKYEYRYPIIQLCGSKRICEQFLEYSKTLAPDCKVHVHRDKGIYGVALSGKFSIPVIRELYNDCSVSLDRKSTKAQEVISCR